MRVPDSQQSLPTGLLATTGESRRARLGVEADLRERFLVEVTALKSQLMAYCRHVTWTSDEHEDVLQSALSTAFASFQTFTPGSNFRAWMFRYAQNAAYQHNRRRRPASLGEDVVAPELDASAPMADEDPAATRKAVVSDPTSLIAGFDERVHAAVRTLSDPERTSLLLRSVAGCTYAEIAEIMAMPSGTVMSHLARARAKMRARLAGFHKDAP
jgi:RNA polymerase sigma-70 factor (ECF subfamily)